MQWKIAGIQFAALLVAVLVGVKLFTPGNASDSSLDSRLGAIEERLDKIEKNLADAERGPSSFRPSSNPHRAEKQPSNLPIVNNALPAGKAGGRPAGAERGSLSSAPIADPRRAEGLPADIPPPEAALPPDENRTSTNPSPKASPQAFDSFFEGLSADKRSLTEGIFQAHLESLRFRMEDATKQGSSSQELNQLIYDDQLQIREEMKQVLNAQEYKAFIDAAPVIPKPH